MKKEPNKLHNKINFWWTGGAAVELSGDDATRNKNLGVARYQK